MTTKKIRLRRSGGDNRCQKSHQTHDMVQTGKDYSTGSPVLFMPETAGTQREPVLSSLWEGKNLPLLEVA